ncbi:MAG TPA: septal ring lytic transglycosylase RlpA family protein, partial [Candidatus Gracilibacteria bacterium]
MQKRFYSLFLVLLCAFVLRHGIAQAKFVDVDTTHPYFYGIDFLEQEDILRGYKNGEFKYFRPLQEINRVEGLKILLLSANLELDHDASVLPFPDTSKQSWYTPFVVTALNNEIANGYPNGNFHPENKISLAEFLKMLILAFDIDYAAPQENQKWFTPFLERARQLHIVTSPDDPSHIVTRGEAAEMVFRAINVIINDFRPYVFSGSGEASYYNEGFAGNVTASGEIYDPFDLTAAHRILPFGTKLRVINEDNAKSVVVRVNDRGPYHQNRVLDLSQRAFETLSPISAGVVKIKFEVISDPSQEDLNPTIPEYIRPALKEEENRQPMTPSFIQERISKDKASLLGETIEEKINKATEAAREPAPSPVQVIDHKKAIFSNTIQHISNTFYPGVTLRRSIPQRIALGTIIKFSGMADELHKEATLFIHDGKSGEQQKFVAPVSGKTFSFPIAFLKPGHF